MKNSIEIEGKQVLVIGEGRGPRARERLVDWRGAAARVEHGQIRVLLGGTVANAYGYRAYTEGAVVVGVSEGAAVVYLCEIPANKATLSGVLAACRLPRALQDCRYGAAATALAEAEILCAAAREARAA